MQKGFEVASNPFSFNIYDIENFMGLPILSRGINPYRRMIS
ncbi:hypothetical protein [Alkaliphilus serpentinus]|nr:hypothetical protein [Alkaliphilus serpentinus]